MKKVFLIAALLSSTVVYAADEDLRTRALYQLCIPQDSNVCGSVYEGKFNPSKTGANNENWKNYTATFDVNAAPGYTADNATCKCYGTALAYDNEGSGRTHYYLKYDPTQRKCIVTCPPGTEKKQMTGSGNGKECDAGYRFLSIERKTGRN